MKRQTKNKDLISTVSKQGNKDKDSTVHSGIEQVASQHTAYRGTEYTESKSVVV